MEIIYDLIKRSYHSSLQFSQKNNYYRIDQVSMEKKEKKRKNTVKYIGILILLSIPLFGVIGFVISRSRITPNDDFFVVNKGETPVVDVNTWSSKQYYFLLYYISIKIK